MPYVEEELPPVASYNHEEYQSKESVEVVAKVVPSTSTTTSTTTTTTTSSPVEIQNAPSRNSEEVGVEVTTTLSGSASNDLPESTGEKQIKASKAEDEEDMASPMKEQDDDVDDDDDDDVEGKKSKCTGFYMICDR